MKQTGQYIKLFFVLSILFSHTCFATLPETYLEDLTNLCILLDNAKDKKIQFSIDDRIEFLKIIENSPNKVLKFAKEHNFALFITELLKNSPKKKLPPLLKNNTILWLLSVDNVKDIFIDASVEKVPLLLESIILIKKLGSEDVCAILEDATKNNQDNKVELLEKSKLIDQGLSKNVVKKKFCLIL